MSSINITITESAQNYLVELLAKQEGEIGVRIFIEKPGTPYAECCMAYCSEEEVEEGDESISFNQFTAYIENKSLPYLEDAIVDYQKEKMGGQLTFRAPKSKVPQIGENASLEERINYVLSSEINPGLSAHGGNVALIALIDDDTTAVLQFGGGCQGCAAVDMTLKQNVEKTLIERVPEIEKVVDQTDHTNRANAYYNQ